MVQLMRERAGTMLAADGAGREPVTVADELRRPGRPALRCPASVLAAGELRARGVPAACGPVQVGTRPAPRMVGTAELGDGIALAVAATGPWQAQTRRVVADWLAVAGERTILLPSRVRSAPASSARSRPSSRRSRSTARFT